MTLALEALGSRLGTPEGTSEGPRRLWSVCVGLGRGEPCEQWDIHAAEVSADIYGGQTGGVGLGRPFRAKTNTSQMIPGLYGCPKCLAADVACQDQGAQGSGRCLLWLCQGSFMDLLLMTPSCCPSAASQFGLQWLLYRP